MWRRPYAVRVFGEEIPESLTPVQCKCALKDVVKLGNTCCGRKNALNLIKSGFLAGGKQYLRPQHLFLMRLRICDRVRIPVLAMSDQLA